MRAVAAPPGPEAHDLEVVAAAAAARAAAVDRGEIDVRVALAELGGAGLLGLGADGQRGSLADQAQVLRSLARGCLSTAFSAWAQRMAVGYLAR